MGRYVRFVYTSGRVLMLCEVELFSGKMFRSSKQLLIILLVIGFMLWGDLNFLTVMCPIWHLIDNQQSGSYIQQARCLAIGSGLLSA